ncbi:MAG: tRNA pseudouridine(38-40) synthase TruA [Actinobacteria bacterium]|nr:tRNA pseudouridine(38-40) synthase TruA [Actinomycetota bacterium]
MAAAREPAPDRSLFDDAPEGRARLKLVVAYDGSDFHGFASQPDVRTVEGVLVKALEKLLRHEVALSCAGRTDAGVHAWGQVVSLEADPGVDPWRLRDSLNAILGPEVVVRECEMVEAGFDARHSAASRAYRYTVVNRPEPDPFLARYAWWVPQPLALAPMRMAADPFIGEHDFSAFCRRVDGKGRTRTVTSSRWIDLGDGVLRYDVTATAFCWQMVRSMVGTLVDVGRGLLRPGDITAILRSGDRQAAGQVAPPHGLCLWEVAY